MPVCSDCKFDVEIGDYSSSQLKKKPDTRMCKACAVVSQPLAPSDVYKLTDDEFGRQMKKRSACIEDRYTKMGNESEM